MRNFRIMYGTGPDSQTGKDTEYYLYLDGIDGFYFMNPKGLGYTESVSAGKIVSGFYNKTHTDVQWPNITGTLYITKMADAKGTQERTTDYGVYDAYRMFMTKIHSAKHLYLDYSPEYNSESWRNIWYRTEVALMSIDKSEIVVGDTLQCDITFARLTPWFTEWELEVNSIRVSNTEIHADPIFVVNGGSGKLDSCYRIEVTNVPECDYLQLWLGYKVSSTSEGIALGECNIYPKSGKFSANSVSYSSSYNDVYVKINGTNAIDQVDISKNVLLRGNVEDYTTGIDSPLWISIVAINPTTPVTTENMSAKVYQSDYYRSV